LFKGLQLQAESAGDFSPWALLEFFVYSSAVTRMTEFDRGWMLLNLRSFSHSNYD
jgi:hypothetical protein